MSTSATGPRRERAGCGPQPTTGSLLFPSEPRSVPGHRALKISLRAAHVLGAGVATGAYLLEASDPLRRQWLLAATISGLAIFLLDLYESGVFLLQLRGWVVLAKTGLVGALPLFADYRGGVLAVLVVVSVLSSHAPGRVRYFMAFGRDRFRGAETKG